MFSRVLGAWAIVVSAAVLQACATEWGRAIHLPQGDENRGRETFVDLRCHAHEVDGFDPPTPIVAADARQAWRTDRFVSGLTTIS